MDQSLLLAIAIALLSLSLSVAGVYVVLVLRDLRRTLTHANKILGRLDSMSEHIDTNLIRPASSIAGVLALLREGVQMVGEVKNLSQGSGVAAKAITQEVREVVQVVKEELAPSVAEAAKEVVQEISDQVQEASAHISDQVKEVVTESATEAKAVLAEAKLATKPEPLASRSLSSSRRRFFTKKH